MVQPQRGVEEGEAFAAVQRRDAGAGHPAQVSVAERAEHAAFGPRSPRQRLTRQTEVPPVLGEGVQERVRRRVVALPGGTEHPGDRGEHHEQREVQFPRQLVQVPRAVHLGAQHGVDPFGGEGRDDPVVQHTCRVHDTDERVLRRNIGEHAGERVAVGDIARRGAHVGVQVGQLRRDAAATADQEQVPNAVLGDQVTCHPRSQRATGAGDEHGACGVDGGLRRGGGDPYQARHPQFAGTDRDLRLPGGDGFFEVGAVGRVLVGIDEDEAARVLGLRGPDQSPDCGRGGTAAVSRSSRHDDEAGVGVPLVRNPLPHDFQYLVHGGVRVRDDVASRVLDDERHDVGRFLGVFAPGAPPEGGVDLGPAGRLPVDGEHRVAGVGAGDLPGHGSYGEGTDLGDRLTGLVGQGQRGATGGRGDANAERAGADRRQGHIGPRERQGDRVVAPGEGHAVQGGVPQGGVKSEPVDADALGQPDVGVDLVALAPGGGQPSEGGPVGQSPLRESIVEILDGDRLRVRRRPGHECLAGNGGAWPQGAGGVVGPLVVPGPRVDVHRAPTVGVRGRRGELNGDGAAHREDEGRVQGQLFEDRAVESLPGVEGEFDERGAG